MLLFMLLFLMLCGCCFVFLVVLVVLVVVVVCCSVVVVCCLLFCFVWPQKTKKTRQAKNNTLCFIVFLPWFSSQGSGHRQANNPNPPVFSFFPSSSLSFIIFSKKE